MSFEMREQIEERAALEVVGIVRLQGLFEQHVASFLLLKLTRKEQIAVPSSPSRFAAVRLQQDRPSTRKIDGPGERF